MAAASPKFNKFPALLTWADPVASGKVFVGGFTLLYVLKNVNLVATFYFVAFLALGLSAAIEFVSSKLNGSRGGFVSQYHPKYYSLSKECIDKAITKLAAALDKSILSVQKLVYAENVCATTKAAGVSYFLYKLTSLVPVYCLLTTAFVLAFVVPPVYLKFYPVVDESIDTAMKVGKEKAEEAKSKVSALAAPHLQKLESKIPPGLKQRFVAKPNTSSSAAASVPEAVATGAEKAEVSTSEMISEVLGEKTD